jgi:putative ABC transport system ATP-binding protein
VDVFTLKEVTATRGGIPVLQAITAGLPAGACTAVTGRSGAGKSTLLRLLTRLEDPTSGAIRFLGRPLMDYNVLELRRRVASIAQTPILLTGDVLSELRVGRIDLPEERARVLLAQVGLPEEFVARPTQRLSVGQAQRVCIAKALVLDPEVVLLDEPTAALDPVSARAIEALLTDLVTRDVSIVVVTHDLGLTRRVADHQLVLDAGRLDSAAGDRHPDRHHGAAPEV